jgi:hypothetical protein
MPFNNPYSPMLLGTPPNNPYTPNFPNYALNNEEPLVPKQRPTFPAQFPEHQSPTEARPMTPGDMRIAQNPGPAPVGNINLQDPTQYANLAFNHIINSFLSNPEGRVEIKKAFAKDYPDMYSKLITLADMHDQVTKQIQNQKNPSKSEEQTPANNAPQVTLIPPIQG